MGSVYFGFWGKVPDKKEITSIKQAVASGIYDMNGDLIGKYFIYDRELTSFHQLPKHLVDALVATEDARFFEHNGVDTKSLFRVLIKSILLQDDSAGGGSTITMQLAKNLFGREELGIFSMPVNKYKEAIVAGRLEDIYSKEEIIELYLNTVTFSDNTYGIESAAKKFFNKEVSQLNLEESATLIGTLKANNGYNPRLYKENSLRRRNTVISQMVKYGYLSKETADTTTVKDIELSYRSFQYDEGTAPYFRERVRQEALKLLKDIKKPDGSSYDMYKDGLKIYTTLDLEMQEIAEASMQKHMSSIQNQYEKAYGKYAPWAQNKKIFKSYVKRIPKYQLLKKNGLSEKAIMDSLSQKHLIDVFNGTTDTILEISPLDSLEYQLKQLNTGFVAIDPSDGAIRSYIGGVNFKHFKYDHISQSKRQVGSTFKPFVYTTALENGVAPCSYFSIEAVTYEEDDNWRPENATTNDEDDEHTFYSLKYALSNSVNTIAVKVLKHVGVDNVIKQAKKMGIEEDLPQVSSIALGTAGISIKDMAGSYASFVNESKPVTPYFIVRIEDKNGNVIMENDKNTVKNDKAFTDKTRQVMIEFLKTTVDKGTAKRLRYAYHLNNDIAGKTGTTQDNKDAWFIGITPKLVTVTWVGNDEHQIGFNSTRIGQGANAALPMFGNFYSQLSKNNKFNNITNATFEEPSEEVMTALECEDRHQETFVERVFGNPNTIKVSSGKDEDKEEKTKKEKKGFFSFLKKKKNK
ncbi:transglycosylase domain-containing protein [Neptunitalea lumnitzerae]|uniref:Penicillin-binding protein 1A n=1 Tax=Neptunitalea lumnitzerae TaxID=2965509 RepID=A0ABQ5MJJ7_9FLAO|nr:transglycosylase domain-containing protein [Neptunitalea sp. Y10]GLB49507.1 penicillin-binding protein 1A [Neptunitalea sp. Y10]